MISLEGQTEIKKGTRERETGGDKKWAAQRRDSACVEQRQWTKAETCHRVWVWSEWTAVPSGSGAANPIC